MLGKLTSKWQDERCDSTRFAWLHPNLETENPGGGQGPPTSFPLPPTTREDLRLDGYLDALYIYKHSCLLLDSNPVPTARQSASLTNIPVGLVMFSYGDGHFQQNYELGHRALTVSEKHQLSSSLARSNS
ncbi:uncharacterized protein TNCV_4047231 [Trichonephila clavipes]|nr:uncharacterized protein TNCV_4047231 [Trichonephila clavipes]